MKKTRVHELAKEFHKDARELLDLLTEMGIEAVSHASSLSDEDAERVRDRLKTLQTHKITQQRISTGVIRRRKDAIAPQAETSAVGSVEDVSAEPPVEFPEPTSVQPEPAVAVAPAGEPEAVAAPEAAPTPGPGPEREPARRARPAKFGPSARIVKPAPAAKVIKPAPAAKVLKPAPAEPVPASAPVPTAQPEVVRPVPPMEPQPAPGAMPEPVKVEVRPAAQAEPEEDDKAVALAKPLKLAEEDFKRPSSAPEPEEGEAEAGAAKPLQDSLKVKRPRWQADEPARIISRPSVIPAPKPAERRGFAPPVPTPLEELLAGDKPGEQPKRRKGGKPGEDKRKGKKREIGRAELYAPSDLSGRLRGGKPKRGAAKKPQKTQITQPKAIKMRIKVAEAIGVAELAKRMGVKATDVVKQLLGLGMMVSLNQTLDLETATIVANEFGYEVERSAFEEAGLLRIAEDNPDNLRPRPPVVTIMGHVDHGKSSLLEAISTQRINIVDGEAGGITQHIGAYLVSFGESQIVFLDTPGHEAFTAMRARGAAVTDIVVLVVAADDGVMEQTKEAVNHAKAAEVPIIVAVNKMDKPTADPERVKRELTELGLQPEDWGGETLFAMVSAKTGKGIDDLLEAIRLQAEVLELEADPTKPAVGRVVEAQIDRGRGTVATVLVQGGMLKVGDAFVVGAHYGKVRALFNDRGQPVDSAGPSIPVQVQGISGVPEAGDEFIVVEDEKVARQISDHRQAKRRETELSQTTRISLENFLEQAQGEVKDLNIVIKADVQGSLEALRGALEKLSTDKVKLNVIHTGAGAITESDVMLASASQAIIIGFNVRANPKVHEVIEAEKVEVRYYDVIYKAIEEVREAMAGLLDSIFKEHSLGRAEVRLVYKISGVGTIAGSYIVDGLIRRGAKARLLRDGVVVYDGKVGSLKRFKDDAREVASGYECGIGLENFNDLKVGDIIEAYELEEIRPELAD